MAIYSGFSHWTWWFSIAMLNYQRVLEWMFLLHLKKIHIPPYISVYHRISPHMIVYHRMSPPYLPWFCSKIVPNANATFPSGLWLLYLFCIMYCIYLYVYIYIYIQYIWARSPDPHTPPLPPQWYPPPLLTPPTPPKPSICMLFAHIHTHIHIYTPLSTRPTSHLYVICSTWEPRPRQRTLSTCIFLS